MTAENANLTGEKAPKQINLAFIGGGMFAQHYHLPALTHLRQQSSNRYQLHLRGIYRRTTSAAEQLAQAYGFERAYTSLEELLSDDVVDAVAVIVPEAALASLVTPLAAQGLPIFTEKPPGADYVEAVHLSQIVTAPNVVAFNRRFIPLNNTFKQIVDEMSHIFFVEGHFLRHNRRDKKFALNTAVHWINYMEYLFGEIRAVDNLRYRNPQSESWVWVARLTFASGLHGLLKIFPDTGAQSERLEVHSSKRVAYLYGPLFMLNSGQIVIEETRPNPERPELKFGKTVIPDTIQTVIPGPPDTLQIVEGGYVSQYQEFFEAVCYGTPTRSNFQNATNTMRVAEAIEQGYNL